MFPLLPKSNEMIDFSIICRTDPDNGIRAGSGFSMVPERSVGSESTSLSSIRVDLESLRRTADQLMLQMMEMEVQEQARLDQMEADRVRDKDELKRLIHNLYGESPHPNHNYTVKTPSSSIKLQHQNPNLGSSPPQIQNSLNPIASDYALPFVHIPDFVVNEHITTCISPSKTPQPLPLLIRRLLDKTPRSLKACARHHFNTSDKGHQLFDEISAIEGAASTEHKKPAVVAAAAFQDALPENDVSFNVKKVAVKDLKHGYVASNSMGDLVKEAANSIPLSSPTKLNQLYFKLDPSHNTHHLFDEIPERILQSDLVSWSSILRGLVKKEVTVKDGNEAQPEVPKELRGYSVEFYFLEPVGLTMPLLQLIEVSFSYLGWPDFRLTNVDTGIDMGTRIEIVRPNGAGKSTLHNLLAGDLQPAEGEVRRSQKLRIGRYSHYFVDLLTMEENVVQFLLHRHPEQSKVDSINKRLFVLSLDSLGSPSRDHLTPIVKLSCRQKSRVVFTSISMSKPHIHLLDVPMNHLDMHSIDTLAEALEEFMGGVVLVSHDSRLIFQVSEDVEQMFEELLKRGNVRVRSRIIVCLMG